MGTIAERRFGSVFALAPPEGLLFRNLDLHRLQPGSLVGSIAKRRMR